MPKKRAGTPAGTPTGTPVGRVVETRRVEHIEPMAGFEEVEEQPSLASQAAFTKLSKLFGDQAVKCIIRRKGEDKKWDYMETIPTEDFSLDYVRDMYGGGEYQVQAIDEDGDYIKSFSCSIDPRYKGRKWTEVQSSAHGTGADGSPSWIAAAIDKLGDAVKELKEVKAAPAPAMPDPMAMIEKLATTMRALTPPPSPPPPPPAAPQSLKDQLETIKSVIEVGTSIVDARGETGGGSGDAYMGAIAKLADPIVELVKTKAQQEQLRMAPPRRPVLPAPAQPPATGPVPPQPEPARQETHVNWLMEIQRWLPLIVKRQQKGASAESTAYFVLDELSEQTLTALAEFLQRDDAEMALKQVLPAELNNNPAWLSEFLTAVRDYLFTEEDDDNDANQDDMPPAAGPSRIIDLEEEAAKRLGKLRDKPSQEPEAQAPEQPPA